MRQKESVHLEFKEAASALPNNLFETICAMLNSQGGDILLGIRDDGSITGIQENALTKMMADLVNLSNNPLKLDPPFILFPHIYDIDGKKLIHIDVPVSSEVHRTGKIIYERSNDGDFKVEQPRRIARIVNRKGNYYTEDVIYPGLKMENFKQDLFQKIRNLIGNNYPDHPWLSLNNRQLLEMAGLWRIDSQLGVEGYTMAAALLLGKDEVIHQIVPHYKIDALVRVNNLDRYDDRLYIQTNLIDAHDLLMDFVDRHLPDGFYLVGGQRVSLRATIFREIVANLIIHREYTNAAPARFIIYADHVETTNANNPHGEGPIDPENFKPFPKNPTLAKFFIQLGRAEELGSGILTASRLIKNYAGKGKPVFIEGETFKTVIPIPGRQIVPVSDTVNDTINLIFDTIKDTIIDTTTDGIPASNKKVIIRLVQIIEILRAQPGLKSRDIAELVELSDVSVRRYIQKLTKLVEYRGSLKTGGYYLSEFLLLKLDKKSR